MGCASCNKLDLTMEQNNEVKEEEKFETFRAPSNKEEVNENNFIEINDNDNNNNNNGIVFGNAGSILRGAPSQAGFETKEENKVNENHSQNNIAEIFSENDFNELMNTFPELEDGVKVEIRSPQENDKDKTQYYGEWDINNNVRHGRGIQIWADGAKYIGYWKNDKACGKGKLFHSDGDIYEGEWENDKPNGYGIYTHKDGTRYEGEWKDDKQNGFGKEIWVDGALYEGYYVDGKKKWGRKVLLG